MRALECREVRYGNDPCGHSREVQLLSARAVEVLDVARTLANGNPLVFPNRWPKFNNLTRHFAYFGRIWAMPACKLLTLKDRRTAIETHVGLVTLLDEDPGMTEMGSRMHWMGWHAPSPYEFAMPDDDALVLRRGRSRGDDELGADAVP